MLDLIENIKSYYKEGACIASLLAGFFLFFYKPIKKNKPEEKNMGNKKSTSEILSKDYIKSNKHVLFIDDNKYPITELLIKNGWHHVKLVHEIESLSDDIIKNSDIILVDVIGVGHNLGFQDQGYGLALALKNDYPDKKIIIYSQEANEFHEALKKVDSVIKKRANIYLLEQELLSLYEEN